MKTKLSGIMTLLLAFVVQITFAQEQTITGTVSDETGPLPGVSVIIEGTTTGTETDFDGNYTVTANTGEILRYSFVGMTTLSRTVGDQNVINVTMVSESNTLDEVVVTALGIKREKKSLGYATQEVDGSAVNTVKDPNFVNSLSGKVAGIEVKSSGTMGGSSNVIIRGASSLTGSNQALFVIDGVPVSNSNTNSGNQTTGRGGYDYGNAASDINPDDIETINVLKGGVATALYGSRAGNGVIVITTKKGKSQRGIGVTVNSSVMFNKFNEDTFAKYQNEYGAGYGAYYGSTGYFFDIDMNGDGVDDLVTPSTEDASFGGAFDPNLSVYQWDSWYPELDTYLQPTPWVAAENDPTTFFQTGTVLTNSVSLSGGNEQGNFRLGYTNLNQKGILPNSEIIRDNIDFGASYNITDKLTANVKASYIKTKGKGRFGTGYDALNPMQSFKQWFQVNVDIQDQKEAYFATRKNITWNATDATNTDAGPIYFDNPYWVRYENYQNDVRHRVIGHVALNYEINDWLSVYGRVTLDNYNDFQEERINKGSVDVSRYSRYNRNYNENNYDLMLNFDKNITDNLNLRAVLGSNVRRETISSIYAQTNGGLNLPGLYSLANSANPIAAPGEYDADLGVDGYYANVSLGWNNMLYLDASYRMDRFSSLPRGNDTQGYGGVSGSFVFSSLLDANWLSLGKLRAGWAKTGNGTSPYRVSNTYVLGTPIGGQPIASLPSANNNPDLVPETSDEFEVGLEMAFFRNRLGFDFSYYDKTNNDLLTPVTISTATGFTSQWLNAGKTQNKGMELSLWGSPVKTENFEWRIDLNWAQNKNEVLELPQGLTNLELASLQGGVSINATVGEPYGTIRGSDHEYIDGKPVVNSSGYYKKATGTHVIGNYQADWTGGLNNRFTYKNLTFSFLIDMKKGGDLFSLDQWYGQGTGVYANTAGLNDLGNPLRDPVSQGGGEILPGVKEDGTPNDIRSYAGWYANGRGWARAVNTQHVYDAGFIKLREVALSYRLGENTFGKSLIQAMTFTASGRNLWLIDSSVPYADPEAGLSSGNVQGYQSGAYPSTKDYGFSVKIEF
ncbi:MAG: SusC/RagA family TonB-linked outer membrane protein [Flavobacteriaceae bacterium]|nr:SusC/RagA family TonB-linked outer membrane protein [Flavobacteriaceae bacterium]